MFEITATIVIFDNEREELLRAIRSFLDTEMNVHLYLVGNSATDVLRDVVDDPRVEYHFNGGNVGFGAGHNIILEKIDKISKYHILLNPDVTFEKGTIEALYEYMEANPQVGLSTGDVFLPTGERQHGCRLLPNPLTLVMRRLAPSLAQDIYCRVDYSKPMNVPYLAGCFMFIRTSVLKEVGYFDTRYFLYCEDMDFCRRVHEKYETICLPSVRIVHEYHRESSKRLRQLGMHLKSAFKYFNKWGWFVDEKRSFYNKQAIASLSK